MRTKKAFYNIVTNLILQFIVIIYGFVVPIIIIGNYGSEVNGLISSITQFLAYISLIEAGVGGIVQFLLYKPIANKDTDNINDILAAAQKFFSKVSGIFIIYIALLCVFFPLIVDSSFDRVYTISLIIIISINIFSEYYFGLIYKIYLFADQKKYIVSLLSIFTYALNIIVIVILSKFNVSIQLLKLVSTLLFTLRPILQNLYVRKKYQINIKLGNKNYVLKQKWDALAQHIASVIHSSTDITILTFFGKLSEISIYSVYFLVVSGVRKIVSIFYDSISSGFGDMIARKEEKKLNEVFNIAESMFLTFVTISFSCTVILITPFVQVYTIGISDVNYSRTLFGYLIVIAELFGTVRFPYSSITLAAGHYTETRNGAILECVINLIVSIVLVIRFGLIGVAIGTIVAMFIRTCEFVYHSSKYILGRSLIVPIKKILLMFFEISVIFIICRYLSYIPNVNYFNLLYNSFMVFIVSSSVCLLINGFIYRKDFKSFKMVIKAITKRRKV